MSELGQIKQQIMQFSAQVGQAAYNIKQLELDMDKQIGFIEQIIGGASDNADKQMIAALEQAKKSVNDAALQLILASNAASDWSARS